MKQRLFSGIQPSGNLHLGNYLGAIRQWVKLQDEPARNASSDDAGGYEALFCVVDLHAITVPQDPAELRRRTLEIAKIYLAAGIDPAKATLFVQSHIPEHTELGWILNTIARMSDLERMTQYKDKVAGKENLVGLFDYPVLMAADILLYDTAVVPVGEDQVQHIELARTLARRFNDRFGETFVVPEARVIKGGSRIMGLDDPTKKMSKSAASEYNFIALTDDVETVRRKIRKAVTDSGSEVLYDDGKPALKNLINIYTLLSDKTKEEVVEMYRGKGYGEFKADLAEVIVSFLTPFQERLAAISDDEVLRVLAEGREKVRPLAAAKMREVYERVGMIVD